MGTVFYKDISLQRKVGREKMVKKGQKREGKEIPRLMGRLARGQRALMIQGLRRKLSWFASNLMAHG